jgi:hypothetical protein
MTFIPRRFSISMLPTAMPRLKPRHLYVGDQEVEKNAAIQDRQDLVGNAAVDDRVSGSAQRLHDWKRRKPSSSSRTRIDARALGAPRVDFGHEAPPVPGGETLELYHNRRTST